jgi:hypothetical protein
MMRLQSVVTVSIFFNLAEKPMLTVLLDLLVLEGRDVGVGTNMDVNTGLGKSVKD